MQRKQKPAATIGYYEAIKILPGYPPAESGEALLGEKRAITRPYRSMATRPAYQIAEQLFLRENFDGPYGCLQRAQ